MKTKQGFTLRALGQEYILVAEGLEVVNFNRMVSMNATAAMLWKEVDGKTFDADTLATLLAEHYQVEPETAKKDALALLESWTKAGIIEE